MSSLAVAKSGYIFADLILSIAGLLFPQSYFNYYLSRSLEYKKYSIALPVKSLQPTPRTRTLPRKQIEIF